MQSSIPTEDRDPVEALLYGVYHEPRSVPPIAGPSDLERHALASQTSLESEPAVGRTPCARRRIANNQSCVAIQQSSAESLFVCKH